MRLWNLKFSKFFYCFVVSIKWPLFGLFWALTPSNIVLSCWKFNHRYSPIRKTQCLKNPSKFWIWLKWNAAEVYSFGPFWGPIYFRKSKNIAKNQDFCKKSILGNNYVSPRSQKNHRILEKLSLKTFLGLKLGLNCHHGLKGHSQILT